MSSFVVQGECSLSGSLTPQGAKNEALQVISATLLSAQPVRINNIPNIADVRNLIALLGDLGVEIRKENEHDFTFCARDINHEFLDSEEFLKKCMALRGSVLVVGPLMGRTGHTYFPKPGGDKIGRRRIDTHIAGLIALGADCSYDTDKSCFTLSAKDRLRGAYMLLDEASVTGTANIIMAAVLAQGTTTIYNAACEPYIQQLCRMLCAMGAQISGIGSNLLTITGVDSLGSCTHTIQPDMIEVGSFIGMAAMTRSALTLKNVDLKELGIIPAVFRRLGIEVEQKGADLFVPRLDKYTIDTFMDGSTLTIADAPWPGLTPDLISVLLVVATQAEGSVLIHQKMFESRLFFVDKLIDMGARIILCDPHRAVVIGNAGRTPLKHANMVSPDIRAGVALLMAAMTARGTSVIDNIEQIDRGYEQIDVRLNALGAHITRV